MPRSIVDGTRTSAAHAALFLESRQDLPQRLADRDPGGVSHRSVANAGDTPTQTSRGSRAARRCRVLEQQDAGVGRLLGQQILDRSLLADRVDLRPPPLVGS